MAISTKDIYDDRYDLLRLLLELNLTRVVGTCANTTMAQSTMGSTMLEDLSTHLCGYVTEIKPIEPLELDDGPRMVHAYRPYYFKNKPNTNKRIVRKSFTSFFYKN